MPSRDQDSARRSRIGHLRPVLAVPFPCIAERASAMRPPNRTARLRMPTRPPSPDTTRRAGTDVLHLRPAVAVPFPGIAEQHAVERIAPEHVRRVGASRR